MTLLQETFLKNLQTELLICTSSKLQVSRVKSNAYIFSIFRSLRELGQSKLKALQTLRDLSEECAAKLAGDNYKTLPMEVETDSTGRL